MTDEDALIDDLSRLLREGLVMVDPIDLADDDAAIRFRPTQRGIAELIDQVDETQRALDAVAKGGTVR